MIKRPFKIRSIIAFPSLISAATAARSVFTTARRITETHKPSTRYVKSARNIPYRMHSSGVILNMFTVAIWLHFFTAYTTGHKEPLPTARLVGVKISTPRLNYCPAIGAASFVFITLHSTAFLSISCRFHSFFLFTAMRIDPDIFGIFSPFTQHAINALFAV